MSNHKILHHPYNNSHPDSKCPDRVSRSGIKLGHKFRTVAKGQWVGKVRSETSECIYCKARHVSTVDYGLLVGIFPSK